MLLSSIQFYVTELKWHKFLPLITCNELSKYSLQQARQSSAPVQGRSTPGPTPHTRTYSAGGGSFSRQAGNPVITRDGHGPMGVTSHKIVSTDNLKCTLFTAQFLFKLTAIFFYTCTFYNTFYEA